MARLICVVSLIVVMLGGHALAQDRDFGLGIILGEPTGVSAKLWLGETIAIGGAVAWSFREDDGVQVHADVLYHQFDLFDVGEAKLPLYLGVGAMLKFEVDDNDNDNRFGIRFPVGIDYIFARVPLDIFFELVPILEFSPGTRFTFNAAIGVRYFFW